MGEHALLMDILGMEDYLGDMRMFLDCVLDHRDGSAGGSEVIGGVQKWRVQSNWKLSAENFVGDLYHEVSHQSANLAEIGPSGRPTSRRRSLPSVVAGRRAGPPG